MDVGVAANIGFQIFGPDHIEGRVIGAEAGIGDVGAGDSDIGLHGAEVGIEVLGKASIVLLHGDGVEGGELGQWVDKAKNQSGADYHHQQGFETDAADPAADKLLQGPQLLLSGLGGGGGLRLSQGFQAAVQIVRLYHDGSSSPSSSRSRRLARDRS